jgi:sialic acid synthase SpsE/RimJ/RimL family protein N-acetyltransferase
MRAVRIGESLVGDGQPCFVIAEAGSNHDGSLAQALALIDAAADAAADAVKFQVFRADRLYPKSAGVSEYLKLDRPIYDIVAELELPNEWLPELVARCRERGILFLASVFDEESVDLVDPFVEAFKVASYEMTQIPLLRHVAAKGKPVIVSTGTANLDEVRASVEAFRATGNEELVLLQCTAAYPAPIASLNVRAIPTLKAAFDLPVGLSDHSRDPVVAPVAAVAVGANMLEKHFTLSNELPGPDHRFAVEPDELRILVEQVRAAEAALGSGEKVVDPVEHELRSFARRSIFAARDIRAGERFTRENLAILRNGSLEAGLAPVRLDDLLGRRAARDIAAETAVREDDVSGDATIGLRLAGERDVRAVWEWRNEESAREASFDSEPVPFERHERWYRDRLADPDTLFYVVVAPDERPVGYVRFALAGGEAEISVALDASTRGRGYGTAAIRHGCEAVLGGGRAERVVAHVKRGNELSRSAFLRAGFVERRCVELGGEEALELVRPAS